MQQVARSPNHTLHAYNPYTLIARPEVIETFEIFKPRCAVCTVQGRTKQKTKRQKENNSRCIVPCEYVWITEHAEKLIFTRMCHRCESRDAVKPNDRIAALHFFFFPFFQNSRVCARFPRTRWKEAVRRFHRDSWWRFPRRRSTDFRHSWNARTRTEPSLRDSRLFTKHLTDYVSPTIRDDEHITICHSEKQLKTRNRLRLGKIAAGWATSVRFPRRKRPKGTTFKWELNEYSDFECHVPSHFQNLSFFLFSLLEKEPARLFVDIFSHTRLCEHVIFNLSV